MSRDSIVLFVSRVLLASLGVVDLLILANVGLRLVIGGPRGVTGYYEHIALEGVNVYAIDPSEARRMVIHSMVYILIVYGILAMATMVMLRAVRRLEASSPGRA
jgi:hypothetical protein